MQHTEAETITRDDWIRSVMGDMRDQLKHCKIHRYYVPPEEICQGIVERHLKHFKCFTEQGLQSIVKDAAARVIFTKKRDLLHGPQLPGQPFYPPRERRATPPCPAVAARHQEAPAA